MFVHDPAHKYLKYLNGLTIKSIEVVNVGSWDDGIKSELKKTLFGKEKWVEEKVRDSEFIDKYAIQINYHNGDSINIPNQWDFDERWEFYGEEGKIQAEKEVRKLVKKLNKINKILIEE